MSLRAPTNTVMVKVCRIPEFVDLETRQRDSLHTCLGSITMEVRIFHAYLYLVLCQFNHANYRHWPQATRPPLRR